MLQYFYPRQDRGGKVVLDPFMGGGTTVVEALRLGYRVIGVDYSPVAWFIVKNEISAVDLGELRAAFKRIEAKVKDRITGYYKTTCPYTGQPADIIYTFWAKKAKCTNSTCQHENILFRDQIVATKGLKVEYLECLCSRCQGKFDWEWDDARMCPVAAPNPNPEAEEAGPRRGAKTGWAYATHGQVVNCPHCGEPQFVADYSVEGKPVQQMLGSWAPEKPVQRRLIGPQPRRQLTFGLAVPMRKVAEERERLKAQRQKVPKKTVRLTVLHCPKCHAVFQVRGQLEQTSVCPNCSNSLDPMHSNISESRVAGQNAFVCEKCGARSGIIDALKAYSGKPADFFPYAIQVYSRLADDSKHPATVLNNGKYFAVLDSTALEGIGRAGNDWSDDKNSLSWPRQAIPAGRKTNDLIKHFYTHWSQLFNHRQLLCLGLMLAAIRDEPICAVREMLLLVFSALVESNNVLCRFCRFDEEDREGKLENAFARHDFQVKTNYPENSVWGCQEGVGVNTFINLMARTFSLLTYHDAPFDKLYSYVPDLALPGWNRNKSAEAPRLVRETSGKPVAEFKTYSGDSIRSQGSELFCQSSTDLRLIPADSVDYVITDPPYAGAVNYAELADFFYVWLREGLLDVYPEYFAPEVTRKTLEIIENEWRGQSAEDFKRGLKQVFAECHRVLKDDGCLAFTFHHSETVSWVGVLDALLEANFDATTNRGGFHIEATYPVMSDAGNSFAVMAVNEGITYDIIFVCRKRTTVPPEISWTELKAEIREAVRRTAQLLRSAPPRQRKLAVVSQRLLPEDMKIILRGKCLEYFSRYYNRVFGRAWKLDASGKTEIGADGLPVCEPDERPIPVVQAINDIEDMLFDLEDEYDPLDEALSGADVLSRNYLRHLAGLRQVRIDTLTKLFKGGEVERQAFYDAGLIGFGRTESKGRKADIKVFPMDRRFAALEERFQRQGDFGLLIDKIHFVLGAYLAGKQVRLALDRWERDLNALAGGCFEVYLREKDEAVREACLEIIEMCRPGWKDRYTARAAQMRMQFATASGDGGDGSDDE